MRRYISMMLVMAGLPLMASAQSTSSSPAQMIGQIYNLSLMIGGILAVGFVIWGGVRYIFNAGNPSGTSAAKDNIYNALIGLTLLLGAYIILNTINPNLTKLQMPELQQIPQGQGGQGGTGGVNNAFTQKTPSEQVKCGGTTQGSCSNLPGTTCENLGSNGSQNWKCLTSQEKNQNTQTQTPPSASSNSIQ